MPKFKIATPPGRVSPSQAAATTTRWNPWGLDAEIVEAPADEDGSSSRRRMPMRSMPRAWRQQESGRCAAGDCRAIVLGSVGVDSVDVVAATARGIPVTNCPDTFIEEVADHAMTLLLAGFRRLIEQDRMVREGRWREGRPALLQDPPADGPDARLHRLRPRRPRGRERAKPFGLRMMAYDPFIEELVMPSTACAADARGGAEQSDFVSMHAPAPPEADGMLTEKHFRLMKKTADLHQHRPRPDGGRGGADQGAAGRLDRRRLARRAGERAAAAQQPAAADDERHPQRAQRLGLGAVRSGRKRHVGRELALVLTAGGR